MRDINSVKYENKGTERKDKERAGRKIKSSPKLSQNQANC